MQHAQSKKSLLFCSATPFFAARRGATERSAKLTNNHFRLFFFSLPLRQLLIDSVQVSPAEASTARHRKAGRVKEKFGEGRGREVGKDKLESDERN